MTPSLSLCSKIAAPLRPAAASSPSGSPNFDRPAVPIPHWGQLAYNMMVAQVLAALDRHVLMVVERDQPDGRGALIPGSHREPVAGNGQLRPGLTVTLQQLDGLDQPPARTADHVDPAANHHLRRIHPALAEPVGIEPLSRGAVLETEWVRPAEAIPIGYVKAERKYVSTPGKLLQASGRARAAALHREEFGTTGAAAIDLSKKKRQRNRPPPRGVE
jgi:hypothetical protein